MNLAVGGNHLLASVLMRKLLDVLTALDNVLRYPALQEILGLWILDMTLFWTRFMPPPP